jgi:hypothetical protein
MSKRLPCPPAPGPLEEYAARFDELFSTLAQRRGFREYLLGLLLPRDRNKALTALAGPPDRLPSVPTASRTAYKEPRLRARPLGPRRRGGGA